MKIAAVLTRYFGSFSSGTLRVDLEEDRVDRLVAKRRARGVLFL